MEPAPERELTAFWGRCMEMRDEAVHVIATGERVILRDAVASEVESVLRWQTSGEWRKYDAP